MDPSGCGGALLCFVSSFLSRCCLFVRCRCVTSSSLRSQRPLRLVRSCWGCASLLGLCWLPVLRRHSPSRGPLSRAGRRPGVAPRRRSQVPAEPRRVSLTAKKDARGDSKAEAAPSAPHEEGDTTRGNAAGARGAEAWAALGSVESAGCGTASARSRAVAWGACVCVCVCVCGGVFRLFVFVLVLLCCVCVLLCVWCLFVGL